MTSTWKASRSKRKLNQTWPGFTLIEAIVAMMIFAAAGIFLISSSAATYRDVKMNELRSQMENLAIEGVNQVRQRHNGEWNNLPNPNTNTLYTLAEVKPGGTPNCNWQSGQTDKHLEPSRCEVVTSINNGSFVRGVFITDASKTVNGVTFTAKEIEVVVSCRQGRCDGGALPPFHLRYVIFR